MKTVLLFIGLSASSVTAKVPPRILTATRPRPRHNLLAAKPRILDGNPPLTDFMLG